ncbi:hypothetical protein CY34DRAFT_19661 [Suillus luteus UH-Slu-Lm8-n1]|uniref:Uncharacterized protein n=1 Tax=Suillus luteus UH-Slu-Lm8-n1 TaxID=930992 RepID=A0A0D0AI37_9AGAM|nr:hypothetical protein CY34DRAFT_19661 [Suillus luteus UH-Slu-Lm8-n1]
MTFLPLMGSEPNIATYDSDMWGAADTDKQLRLTQVQNLAFEDSLSHAGEVATFCSETLLWMEASVPSLSYFPAQAKHENRSS